MRPGKRRKLNPFIEPDFVAERVEKMKASIRAKVEHPFRVLKRQFGFTKVRYRGLAKNTAQIVTLFALSNLWMARRQLMEGRDECAGKARNGLARPPQGCAAQQIDAYDCSIEPSGCVEHHLIHSAVIADRVLQTIPSGGAGREGRGLIRSGDLPRSPPGKSPHGRGEEGADFGGPATNRRGLQAASPALADRAPSQESFHAIPCDFDRPPAAPGCDRRPWYHMRYHGSHLLCSEQWR